jgi:hypothetical protein
MANPIIPKFNANALSTAAPSALALASGELASNLTSGRLYLKLHDGSVADVVPVKSVNGGTGDISITTTSIGALGVSQLGAANGVASLGADSKLASSQLPTITTANVNFLTTAAVAGLVPQLDGGGKISLDQIPASIIGGLTFKGSWDAATNDPALASGVGTKGWYYVVSVAGSTNLDGHTDWLTGDLVVFDGSTWDKIPGSDAYVISVNNISPISGNVTLTAANVGAIATTAINAINGVAGLNGSAQLGTAQLPAATTASLGAISVGDNLTVDGAGRLSAIQGTYTLPAATTAQLGGIIAGSGLAVTLGGDLSVKAATTSTLGGVIAGTGLNVAEDGTLTPDNTVIITTSSSSTTFNGGTY